MSTNKKVSFNYYRDKKSWVKIKSGEKMKLRAWISRLTALITINPIERAKNRELLIKAYNVGGLQTVQAYAAERVTENEELAKAEASKLNG